MSISFNGIPDALRVPGWYIEFDNSLAGSAQIAYKLLLIGQRLSTGTVLQGVPTRVTSVAQAEEFFGRGSMLAEMVAAAKNANQWMDTWCIALDENGAGVAASGTITVTGPATGAGTLALYVAGEKVEVAVASGDTATVIAAAIVAAVTANTSLPVTAANVAGVVTLTAKWKGETGNTIDVRTNYYGEQLPKGVGVAIVDMASGTSNPSVATAIAAMGDEWYNWIVMPFTDSANMVLLETELNSRYGPMRQIGARAFCALRGNHAAATTFGDGRNNPHVSCMATNIAPQPPYIWAAVNAIISAQALSIDPARPLQTLVLTGLMAPAMNVRWTSSERNLLLFGGIATYRVGADGSVMIERQVTTYQTNASGLPDDSYLDINVPETLERIRFYKRSILAQRYPRHKLAEDSARVSPGQPIVQPKLMVAELLSIYRSMEEFGWVQDYDGYKAALVVMIGDGIGGGDRNRLNVQDSDKLVGQYRVHAHQTQFRK